MMPTISLIALVLSLIGQGLTFSAPNTWSFTGTVTEIRQVFVMGLPSQIALVQSADFEAWVILRMDSQSSELPKIVLGPTVEVSNALAGEAPNVLVGVGDLVRVSITGLHVSKDGVDWELCQPLYSNYCRQGGLYDNGPLSGDWNVQLSPSNEFIHWGHSNLSTEYPLFWNSEVLKHATKTRFESQLQQTGRTHPCVGSPAACYSAADFCRLAGQAFGRGCLKPR